MFSLPEPPSPPALQSFEKLYRHIHLQPPQLMPPLPTSLAHLQPAPPLPAPQNGPTSASVSPPLDSSATSNTHHYDQMLSHLFHITQRSDVQEQHRFYFRDIFNGIGIYTDTYRHTRFCFNVRPRTRCNIDTFLCGFRNCLQKKLFPP